MQVYKLVLLIVTALIIVSCGDDDSQSDEYVMSEHHKMIKERIDAYAKTEIAVDISHLSERQQMMIDKLAEAGHIIDELFWQQSSHDAIYVRDSLAGLDNPEAVDMLEYVNINYGPYDVIHGNERFVGDGHKTRPPCGGFYPEDMTKEEFQLFVEKHPDMKEQMESQYTVIIRDDNGMLKPVPYHVYYSNIVKLAEIIEEAASYADNSSLKDYLLLRAEAIRTDDYLESDLAWMSLQNNDVDIVIGPIENYEDELFNYKTAYEVVIMVKNKEITRDIAIFNSHIEDFQKNLPVDNKYKSAVMKDGNVIQAVDVLYFGGDCQKGVKTIAAALPNDPRVLESKGRKNSMYINHIEAKFDKIVIPIGQKLLDNNLIKFVDKRAFTRFVTLHEIAHSLGMRYVLDSKETVRLALQERYSPMEECKADVLSIYTHQALNDMGIIDDEDLNKSIVTYLTGIYRSIRFGSNSAHGRSNLIQLNYLREKGAIVKQENGKLNINMSIFFNVISDLANEVLVIQGEGDYEKAGIFLDKYSVVTEEIQSEIDSLSDIPRDIDTKYEF